MTDTELIKIAKELAGHFARTDVDRATVARLTDVQVRTAALIKFREPGNKKQALDVYLDRDTGEFITSRFMLGHH